jgi:hypothetical protein
MCFAGHAEFEPGAVGRAYGIHRPACHDDAFGCADLQSCADRAG